jgi:hypothetical protein
MTGFVSVSLKIAEARTIFVADAHRGDNQRFIVQADEKLTAFLELESVIEKVSAQLELTKSTPQIALCEQWAVCHPRAFPVKKERTGRTTISDSG